jgi:hypothetical protein
MTEKPSVTMPGTVEKIIPPAHPSEPEKAQIAIGRICERQGKIDAVDCLSSPLAPQLCTCTT